jgi:hypothetical protein
MIKAAVPIAAEHIWLMVASTSCPSRWSADDSWEDEGGHRPSLPLAESVENANSTRAIISMEYSICDFMGVGERVHDFEFPREAEAFDPLQIMLIRSVLLLPDRDRAGIQEFAIRAANTGQATWLH